MRILGVYLQQCCNYAIFNCYISNQNQAIFNSL